MNVLRLRTGSSKYSQTPDYSWSHFPLSRFHRTMDLLKHTLDAFRPAKYAFRSSCLVCGPAFKDSLFRSTALTPCNRPSSTIVRTVSAQFRIGTGEHKNSNQLNMICTSNNSSFKPPYSKCNVYQTTSYSVYWPRKLTIVICEI